MNLGLENQPQLSRSMKVVEKGGGGGGGGAYALPKKGERIFWIKGWVVKFLGLRG